MNTIKLLEHRLQQEVPAMIWHCQPAPFTTRHPGQEDELEIRATQNGLEVPGSPFHLNAKLLEQWGIDAAARMIFHEFTPGQFSAHQPRGFGWDKLAEL